MSRTPYMLPDEGGFVGAFIPPRCPLSKALTPHGGSEWLPQFSAFRGSDKGRIGFEQHLCIRECRHGGLRGGGVDDVSSI